MVLLGQQIYDNFAEAVDKSVGCVMSTDDVRLYLLADPRIATRIAEILGERLREMERRLSDNVFKSVPQRIVGTLTNHPGRGNNADRAWERAAARSA